MVPPRLHPAKQACALGGDATSEDFEMDDRAKTGELPGCLVNANNLRCLVAGNLCRISNQSYCEVIQNGEINDRPAGRAVDRGIKPAGRQCR
jgi:hypothetical protein